MKKLLLLTNLVCLCIMIVCCNDPQKLNNSPSGISNTAMQDSIIMEDSSIRSVQKHDSAMNVQSNVLITDTMNSIREIEHKAPDQQHIDSVKKAKLKGKK